jgi:hypothetical protein
MMKTLTSASVAVAALLLTTSAFGGAKSSCPVRLGADFFTGCFGSVRNSADNIQFLYCADFGNHALCYARDDDGAVGACTTNNPTHLNVIRGMDDSSYIHLTFNAAGQCTSVRSYNYSVAEPKVM